MTGVDAVVAALTDMQAFPGLPRGHRVALVWFVCLYEGAAQEGPEVAESLIAAMRVWCDARVRALEPDVLTD